MIAQLSGWHLGGEDSSLKFLFLRKLPHFRSQFTTEFQVAQPLVQVSPGDRHTETQLSTRELTQVIKRKFS